MQKNFRTVFAFSVIATLCCSGALANEKVDICARYSATGQSYHVQAINTTGFELNQATASFSYNSLGRYIVIFWEQNQASVIEMDGMFFAPTAFPSTGNDQEGRTWEITVFSYFNCSP